MASSTTPIPPKDRFSLPEALTYLEPHGCTREDLYDYLRLGHLRTICYPYRLDPERVVSIEPDEWPERYKDAWEFSVYWGWIGDTNVDGGDTNVPLHIVPRTAESDLKQKQFDGGPAATSAVVYVLRDELLRFIKWLENPSKSRPGRRKKGAGRHPKHDYSDIDVCLESLFQAKGLAGFENLGEAITHLVNKLGENARLPASTLRNHIETWLEKRASATR